MEELRQRIYAAVASIKDAKKLKIILQFILGIKGG